MEESSWIDDEDIQGLWAGLLISSCSKDGRSDENLVFMNMLKQLSSLQVSILNIAVTKAEKFALSLGLPGAISFTISLQEFLKMLNEFNIQRIDRELDYLRELGLIGDIFEGGIDPEKGEVILCPTPLCLHLFVRSQGSNLSPVDFWDLKPLKNETI
jgi:hypothetical protein